MNAMDSIASNKQLLLHKISEALDKLPIRTNVFKYSHYNMAFAISFSDNILIIVYGDSNKEYSFYPIKHTTQCAYDFEKITGIEIDINGNNVSSPSIGGAIAGGILFGGVGAIVGASNTTSIKTIKSVNLKLFVDDIANPYHELNIFKSGYIQEQTIWGRFGPATGGLHLEHPEAKDALNTANEWYSRINTILDKKTTQINIKQGEPALFIADELTKLATLKDKGILSLVEFEKLKMKLLS